MIKARVTVNTAGLGRKAVKLKEALNASGRSLAEKAKAFAKKIAPKESGKTARLIGLYTIQGNNKTVYEIKALNPTASDGHSRKEGSNPYKVNGKFHLVKWMEDSASALSHIHSGNPRFMTATAEWIRQNGNREVRDGFKRRIK